MQYKDTIIGTTLNIKKLEYEINNSIYVDSLDLVTLDQKALMPVCFVTGHLANDKNIPLFVDPIVINNENTDDVTLVVDLRPYLKACRVPVESIDLKMEDLQWANEVEGRNAISRGLLSTCTETGLIESFNSLSKLPAVLFANVISNSIAQDFMLEPKHRDQVNALAYVYYHDLFLSEGKRSEENKDKMTNSIVANLSNMLSPDDIYSILDSVDHHMCGLDAFTEAVKVTIDLLSTNRSLNTGTLLTSLSRIWYGYESKRTIAISMEYPVYWISMCASAVSNRTMRKCIIATTADTPAIKRKHKVDNFIMSYVTLVNNLGG